MLVSLPQNSSLACYQRSSEAHGVHLQSYKLKYVPICKRFLTTEDSPKLEGFASGGCCADSALNPQGPPPPDTAGWQPVPPRLPSCIFHSQIGGGARQETPREDSGMLRLQRREADSRSLAPAPAGMAKPPQRVLAKHRGLLSPCQGGFETISLCGFLSPHQSRSCCTSAWGLDRSHSAMSLPPKYLLALTALLYCGLSSAPIYAKTMY